MEVISMLFLIRCGYCLFYCSLTIGSSVPIISVAPVDTIGCYGGISTFYCGSERSDVNHIGWTIIVDGITYDITDEVAQLRGINITTNGVGNSSSLSIIGSEDNNGIIIHCAVVTSGPPYYDSQSALFTVSDIPPVTNLTITFTNNGTIMNCTWIQSSCLPVKLCYHIFVNNDEKKVIVDGETNYIYSDVSSCETYNVSVIVGDTADQYQDYRSLPTTLSMTNDYYGDVAVEFLQDQSIVTFTDEGEVTIDLFYKFQNITTVQILQKCDDLIFHQLFESFEWITEHDTKEIQDPFHSYDESTGIGNYTIGPFNESFIGNYILMLKKSSSNEPLELASIKISTYHVQEVNITQLSNGSTRIECGFAINSDANGCSVVFINMRSLQIETFFIPSADHDEDMYIAIVVIFLPAGEYYVSVYDVVNGVTQSSTPAVTLDITVAISGSETSDDPVSTLLPSMITSASGLVSDTVSINAAPSMSPPIITTAAEGPTIFHSIAIALVSTILLLLLLVTTVITVKWHKHRNAKHKLTLHSDATTPLPVVESHVYSELPAHNNDNNTSVITAVHTQYNTVDDYLEFNSLFSTSILAAESSEPTAAEVETAINDHDEESGYLVTPQQSSRSHYENIHVLIPREEVTQVQDSHDEDAMDSIQSSMSMEAALPTIQPSELIIDSQPDVHCRPQVPLSSQCSKNEKYLQQSNVHANQFDDISEDDLPDITEIQFLMKRISALSNTFSNLKKENEKMHHSTTGIFGKADLSRSLHNFEQDEQSDEGALVQMAKNDEEFFKIVESYKIIACVGDEEYFIPGTLSPKPDEAARTPFEMCCRPLIIEWDCENFLPQGIFYHMMVNDLLSSKANDDLKFELDVNQWRNEIQIKEVTGKISGIIKLTDKDEWIEISTTTSNTKKDCPSIYESVNKAVTRTLRRFNYAGLDQPTVTTLCPLCPSIEEDHLSILSIADNTVTCSIDSSKTTVITEDISCWFKEQETISKFSTNIVPIANLPPPIIVGSRRFIQPSSYQRSTSSSSEADSNDNLLGHHDKPAIDLQRENKTESSNNSNKDSRAMSPSKNFKPKIKLDIKSFNSMEGSYLFTFEYPISDTVVLDSNEIRSTMLLSAQTSTKHLNDELYSALEKNAIMIKLKENDQKMSELERKRSPCLYKVVKIQTPWKFLTEVILEQQSSLVVSNSVQLSAVLSLPQVVSYTLESQILDLIECPHKSIQSSMISTETALPIQSKDLLIECDVHCGPQVSRVHVVPLSTQHSSNNYDDDYLQHSNDSYDENNNSIQSSMNDMEEATILHTDTQSTDSELHVIMQYFRRYISTDYQLLSIDNTFLDNILHSIGTAGLDATMLNQTEESEKPCHSITGTIQEAKCLRNKFNQLITELNEKLTCTSMIDLNVNAHVRDYFIPSALSPEPGKTQTQLEMYCRPLVIKCGSSFQQSIFYHMMANDLLSSTVNDEFEFKLCNDVNRWRNKIQIIKVTGKISGIIKLTDKNDWIEISTTTDNTKEDCPNIYEAMNKAVTRTSLRRFKYAGLDQPTVTTLCPLCPSTEEDHLSILSIADNTVACSIDSSKTAVIIEGISCWFKGFESSILTFFEADSNNGDIPQDELSGCPWHHKKTESSKLYDYLEPVAKNSDAGVGEAYSADDTLDDMIVKRKFKIMLIVQKKKEDIENIQMQNRDLLKKILQKYQPHKTKTLESQMLDLLEKYPCKKENTAVPWPIALWTTNHVKCTSEFRPFTFALRFEKLVKLEMAQQLAMEKCSTYDNKEFDLRMISFRPVPVQILRKISLEHWNGSMGVKNPVLMSDVVALPQINCFNVQHQLCVPGKRLLACSILPDTLDDRKTAFQVQVLKKLPMKDQMLIKQYQKQKMKIILNALIQSCIDLLQDGIIKQMLIDALFVHDTDTSSYMSQKKIIPKMQTMMIAIKVLHHMLQKKMLVQHLQKPMWEEIKSIQMQICDDLVEQKLLIEALQVHEKRIFRKFRPQIKSMWIVTADLLKLQTFEPKKLDQTRLFDKYFHKKKNANLRPVSVCPTDFIIQIREKDSSMLEVEHFTMKKIMQKENEGSNGTLKSYVWSRDETKNQNQLGLDGEMERKRKKNYLSCIKKEEAYEI